MIIAWIRTSSPVIRFLHRPENGIHKDNDPRADYDPNVTCAHVCDGSDVPRLWHARYNKSKSAEESEEGCKADRKVTRLIKDRQIVARKVVFLEEEMFGENYDTKDSAPVSNDTWT